jgi:N-acetylglutamate synthase-like GNAT family acetyltransferase
MFVGEKFRGNRLSQRLIIKAMNYARELGFEKVYLVSDHENLYEKYGFSVIDKKIAYWGEEEKIYMQRL